MQLREFTDTEQLLLMAATLQGFGPDRDLSRGTNTARVVNQVLRWRGLSDEQIRAGWRDDEYRGPDPSHEEVYQALIRMTHQTVLDGPGRPPERSGPALFEGGGDWGVPGDPD